MGVATVEAVLADLPGWHALKLHFDEAADLVLADVGGETARETIENFGIFGQNDSRTADFLDDGADDILLVLDAVTIAGGVGFALTGEGKGHGAVHMNIPFGDGNLAVGPRHELLVRININATDGVHEVDDGGEIDFEIIIDIDVE